MPRTRNPYPTEFREQLVALARAGRSVESLAREYEPCAATIHGLAIVVKTSCKRWNMSVPRPITQSRSASIRAQSLCREISTSGPTRKVSRWTSRGQESQQTTRGQNGGLAKRLQRGTTPQRNWEQTTDLADEWLRARRTALSSNPRKISSRVVRQRGARQRFSWPCDDWTSSMVAVHYRTLQSK